MCACFPSPPGRDVMRPCLRLCATSQTLTGYAVAKPTITPIDITAQNNGSVDSIARISRRAKLVGDRRRPLTTYCNASLGVFLLLCAAPGESGNEAALGRRERA